MENAFSNHYLEMSSSINYDGFSMPFIVSKNKITALLITCSYDDMILSLVREACVKTVAQT